MQKKHKNCIYSLHESKFTKNITFCLICKYFPAKTDSILKLHPCKYVVVNLPYQATLKQRMFEGVAVAENKDLRLWVQSPAAHASNFSTRIAKKLAWNPQSG